MRIFATVQRDFETGSGIALGSVGGALSALITALLLLLVAFTIYSVVSSMAENRSMPSRKQYALIIRTFVLIMVAHFFLT